VRFAGASIVALLLTVANAPAAAATYGYAQGSASCPYGQQVRIVSLTTMNYTHYWESGYADDWFADEGAHWAYTRTWMQSTDWTVVTGGTLYSAYTDCVYMPLGPSGGGSQPPVGD